jgi:predicted transcriptional regulator
MELGIFALHSDASLHAAIRLLDEEHIHSIIILSKDDKPLGMLTAEAIVNLLAERVSLESPLHQINLMSVIQLRYDTPISTIMDKMKRSHEYKVIITDDKGNPTGVLTEMDILHAYGHG